MSAWDSRDASTDIRCRITSSIVHSAGFGGIGTAATGTGVGGDNRTETDVGVVGGAVRCVTIEIRCVGGVDMSAVEATIAGVLFMSFGDLGALTGFLVLESGVDLNSMSEILRLIGVEEVDTSVCAAMCTDTVSVATDLVTAFGLGLQSLDNTDGSDFFTTEPFAAAVVVAGGVGGQPFAPHLSQVEPSFTSDNRNGQHLRSSNSVCMYDQNVDSRFK